MKLWTGFGSEHSSNLKMVGHFADESAARAVEIIFDEINKRLHTDMDADGYDLDDRVPDLTDEMNELLREHKVWSLGPADVENFAYEHSVTRDGADLILTTDENTVGGFIKLLIDNEASVEIYSMHSHAPDGQRKNDD
jgi:hypothetical protein